MSFAPDNFAGRPYVAGLNQAGHAWLGAAIVGVLSMASPLWLAVSIAGIGILAWEAWQLFCNGAKKRDYFRDLAFWFYGVGSWGWLIHTSSVQGWGAIWPASLVVVFFLEYMEADK